MSLKDRLRTDLALSKKTLQLEYAFNWGVDLDRRVVQLTGDIEEGTFDFVDSAFSELEGENRQTVTVKIHSGGGSVYEALAIVDRMRDSTCRVITEGYGHVMSAATILLAAGEKRRMGKHCVFMHHESQADLGYAGQSVLEHELVQMRRESELWARTMAELTVMPYEYWVEEGAGKNAYFFAEDCLTMGVIDEIF